MFLSTFTSTSMTHLTSQRQLINIFLVSALLHLSSSASTLRFSFGTIQGVDEVSKTSQTPIFTYYGIPFAEPPLGALRFKPPVAYSGRGSDNVISSNGFRDACMQTGDPYPMSEDCLHLNVFTPSVTSQTLRKVMVWVHGGGYFSGSAREYRPTDLVADHDVIVVTLQYRLAFLGFLSTGDEAAPGNMGLWDQILALKWVKANIRDFGGDPDDVTLFGESAGSASVNQLSLSPYTKDLFTKAAMLSGTVYSPWAFISKERSLESFYSLAQRLDCYPWWYRMLPSGKPHMHAKILECLQTKPAELFDQTIQLEDTEAIDIMTCCDLLIYAAPIVDGDLIPRPPGSLLRDADYLRDNGVSSRTYISGATNDEGKLLINFLPETELAKLVTGDNFRKVAENYAKLYFPLGANKQMVDLLEFLYSFPREENNQLNKQDFADLNTDAFYVFPSVKLLTHLAETSPSTVTYQYLFDNYPVYLNTSAPRTGTPHAYDLVYLFDSVQYGESPSLSGQLDMAAPETTQTKDVYMGSLAQFAKTGNPSRGALGKSPASWPRFDLTDRYYMDISSQPEAHRRVYSKRMSLWQDYLARVASSIFGRRWNN